MSLLFSKNHIWLDKKDDYTVIGLSDYAQKKLRSILFISLPDAGDPLKNGKNMGDIESIKTVSDLVSPVSGTVLEVNEALEEDPSVINEDPYGSWFLKIEATDFDPELMSESEYEDYLKSL